MEAAMRLAVLTIISMIVVMPARAQEDLPAPIKFGDGEFTFTQGEGHEVALSYDGKEFYRNYFIEFQSIATIDDTPVALFFGDDGRNGGGCGRVQLIITLPKGRPDPTVEFVEGDCGAPAPAIGPDRLVFAPYTVTPGSREFLEVWSPEGGLMRLGEVHFQPKEGTSWSNFSPAQVEHPYELFDNKDVYEMATKLLGEKFDRVMDGLSVATKPEFIGNRFVIARGCAVGQCTENDAFFGIDVVEHAVYAAIWRHGKPEDFFPELFEEWPGEMQTAWNQIYRSLQ